MDRPICYEYLCRFECFCTLLIAEVLQFQNPDRNTVPESRSDPESLIVSLKGIYPEFQVIRGFSQKIPADLLSYDKIHS